MSERPYFCRECGVKNYEGWGDYCNECRAKERRHAEHVNALKALEIAGLVGTNYTTKDIRATANLLDDLKQAKQALQLILLSQDAEWEEKNLGHDWANAIARAREVYEKLHVSGEESK